MAVGPPEGGGDKLRLDSLLGKSSLEPHGSHGVFSLSRHLRGLGLVVRKMISLDQVTVKSFPLLGLCTKDGLLFLAFSLMAF